MQIPVTFTTPVTQAERDAALTEIQRAIECGNTTIRSAEVSYDALIRKIVVVVSEGTDIPSRLH